MTTPRIGHVTFDCEDAAALAGFWSALLERPVDEGGSEFFATIGLAERAAYPALMFVKVPEPKSVKNRVHLDLHAPDHQAAAARAEELGATRVGDFAEYGASWVALRDPEGNEFDIGASE